MCWLAAFVTAGDVWSGRTLAGDLILTTTADHGDDGINQQAILVLNYFNDLSIDQFQLQNGTPFTIDPALYWWLA